ncbi:MAG TPA: hypothetical protein VE646_00350 [Actinomycetota bacterium]|jgi:hypothetical protein|nr:hypothetical protein [Actinomycetota bacterium]
MRSGDIAQAVGKGLIAGAAGTMALTVSQLMAEKLFHQPMPTASADAAEKLVGVEPKDASGKFRLGMLTHFAYGSLWGVPRALMERSGFRGWRATAFHAAAVQTTAGAVLPALDVGPPPTKMPGKTLGLNTLHHSVYALVTGAVVRLLDRRSRLGRLAPAS